MLRIAICDDQQDVLMHTQKMIEEWKDFTTSWNINVFLNGDDLLSSHKLIPYDIIILDIVMPLFNGIDTAREIRVFDKTVKILFLTSAPEYALESYNVKASNYLLKPVIKEKLYACLSELIEEFKRKTKSISIRSFSMVHRILLDNIAYVEAQNKNVLFHLADGKEISSPQPLYSYENSLTLEDGFYRCHRSYIVNMQYVDTFNPKEARLRNGAVIPISRHSHKEFEAAYFDAIFGKAGEK